MPEEPHTGEYTTLAEQQSISHFQLEQHLKVVDLALDEAFRRALTPGDEWQRDLTAKQISRTRTRTREPEYIDGGAVVWASGLAFYGRMPATTAKESGWYRFSFSVTSLKQPEDRGVWSTIRSGQCVSSAPLMSWIGSFEATERPQVVTVEAWLPEGHMLEIRPNDTTLKKAKFAGGQSSNGEGGAQNVAGISVGGMSMERIHRGPSDGQIREWIFGDLPVTPHRDPSRARVGTDDALTNGRELLTAFANRAFRRPTTPAELSDFYEIFEVSLDSPDDFVAALQNAYRAVLCSARFMYFTESPGRLDSYAIANRLSYMLWNSMPDEELSRAAASGALLDKKEIVSQVDRMLSTPAGQYFVKDFADQWLELSEIDFTEPDSKLHPTFDIIVQYSMLAETQHFLQHLLEENLSIRHLVKSDFTYLNSHLARFYEIDGPEDDQMQHTMLRGDDHRGGLLAQGAILKVTANGTNTSPVVRGVWVSERVLGCPIPPPPSSVPAIEPDIRGAKSIREQLELHRNNAECATCHTKIDPPGYALETFDAAGRWRDFYPQVAKGKMGRGLKIDPSYVTADGREFDNFDEFRSLMAEDIEPVARNFAAQLLEYSTGAKITFSDRDELERLVQEERSSEYGMRALVKAVATSEIFLMK
jgi:hypothetical protein